MTTLTRTEALALLDALITRHGSDLLPALLGAAFSEDRRMANLQDQDAHEWIGALLDHSEFWAMQDD